MTDKFNYEELGLKVGLEIHRQLDTKKLFSLSRASSATRLTSPLKED